MSSKFAVRPSGTAFSGIAEAGDLGDVRSQVTHAGEVGHHAHGRNDGPQLTGNRGLAGQQREAPSLDVVVHAIEGVLADDALSGGKVGLQQRLGRQPDGVADEPRHNDEVSHDRVEVLVVGLAHSGSDQRRKCIRV